MPKSRGEGMITGSNRPAFRHGLRRRPGAIKTTHVVPCVRFQGVARGGNVVAAGPWMVWRKGVYEGEGNIGL